MRLIHNLEWVEELAGWPEGIPRPRPRGVKAFGKRYEKAIAKALGPSARHGVWWRYRDMNGLGLCQTDFLLESPRWTIVLESKHTWTFEAIDQLHDLYLPVVEMGLSRPAVGIQVCKHLTPDAYGQILTSLEDAVYAARRSRAVVTLHWRGLAPMLTREDTVSWLETIGLLPQATI